MPAAATTESREAAALPIVRELPGLPAAAECFRRLQQRSHVLFLDSALRDPILGRYSFLACDPFAWLEIPADGSDALAALSARLAEFRATNIAGLPPFQGGAAGLLSYDLGRSLERVPPTRFDEWKIPALAVGLYDCVVGFDHLEERSWLFSHGWPEQDPAARQERASARADEMERLLREPAIVAAATEHEEPHLPLAELAPQFATAANPKLTSNFTREAYLRAVARAVEYVHAGDVFQVNLAQRLLYPASDDPVSLYLRLRERNAAPFAGYFDLGGTQIVSASPERFLAVHGRVIETRPIKGTRPRGRSPEADLFAGDDLRQSEKDRAENVMIVDLLRNDLSRVCQPESVCVTQLCGLEHFRYVQHLVSAVRGELRPGLGPIDAIRAAFPGGSITGTPKVRAMEIIAELEPTARGPYCGSLGYLGFDGSADLSILIRTITASRGWWQMQVGGGIVAQSSPEREYEETWHKAAGMLKALEP